MLHSQWCGSTARTVASAPVLLLHGGGPGVDAQSNWQNVWEPLSSRFTCLAPDLLGFGSRVSLTRIPQGPVAWRQARARQVLELMDQRGLDRVHVVGNSAAGGAAALELTALAPERIARVVLLGGAGTGPQPARVPFYDDQTRTSMRTTLARLVADERDHAKLIDELTERRWRQALAPGAETAFRAMLGPDEDGRRSIDLSRIHLPVLALHGEMDWVVPIEVSEQLVLELPDARLKVITGAGHWIHVDQPHQFCTEVTEFLSA